jgi:hypothetical protein
MVTDFSQANREPFANWVVGSGSLKVCFAWERTFSD